MTPSAYRNEVTGRLLSRPYLVPIFDHVYDIPNRLRAINPAYYVVLNVSRLIQRAEGLHYKEWTPVPQGIRPRYNAWYEVHKLTMPRWLMAGVTLPFGPLDARAIQFVWERDTELTGDKSFTDALAQNRRLEEERAKRRKQLAHDMATDIRWGTTFFGPGGPTVETRPNRPPPKPQLYLP